MRDGGGDNTAVNDDNDAAPYEARNCAFPLAESDSETIAGIFVLAPYVFRLQRLKTRCSCLQELSRLHPLLLTVIIRIIIDGSEKKQDFFLFKPTDVIQQSVSHCCFFCPMSDWPLRFPYPSPITLFYDMRAAFHDKGKSE
jgi:hypothetical protein